MTTTALAALSCVFLSLSINGPSLTSLQDAQKQVKSAPPIQQVSGEEKKSPAAKPNFEKLSLAEQIAHLKRSIEGDLKNLEAMKLEEENPENEYRQAESRFQALDTHWSEQTKKIQQLKDMGKKAEADLLEKELRDLKKKRDLAKDRFELTIQERKTLREKAIALRTKVQQDQTALSKLTGEGPPVAEPTPAITNGQATENPPSKTPPKGVVEAPPTNPPTARNQPGIPGITPPVKPNPAGNPEAKNAPPTQPPPAVQPVPKELVRARAEAKSKQDAATEATQKVQTVTDRLNGLRKNIGLEQQLLDNARKKAEQAQKALAVINKSMEKARATDPTKLGELSQQKAEITESISKANDAIQASQNRLNELREELNVLQREEIAALREADQKRRESDIAQKKVEQLQNPFTPHNLVQWIFHHGPRLLTILIGMFVVHLLVRLCSHRIAQVISRSSSRGTEEDHANRSLTLVNVFRNTATLAVIGGGTFMILDEVGIPIMPLMGGAAVVGLAVAFGAQNLIRDYFSGFMVLLEDQYGINDVVSIDNIAGVVEKISLRMTVLRDLRGVVHFIPHGTIQRVSNLTHGWSRAFFEIGVAYKEDPDRVMALLIDLAKEIRQDPVHGPDILEDPEMLGVDSLGDSAVKICFFLKTKPLKQWPVQRELLRRIKRKFDELGIEIPFPHRTIYHHYDDGNAPAARRYRDEEAAAA